MNDAVDCVYTDEGAGPAVVFVHGIGARRQVWRKLAAELSSNFRCISYDLRGHGDSPVTAVPFGLDDLVADLERLRERLGLDKIHIVGHSLGGMIGPAYARLHSSRVLSVSLLSTAAFRTEDDRAKVNAVIDAMVTKGIGPVLDTLAARWFTDTFAAEYPEIINARKRQVVDTPPEVFINVFRIYADTEMAPWLHEIDAPCLVLTGEHDGGCPPRLNQQIANALPNSKLVILAGLKHAILIEASEQVCAHLKPFLEAKRF